MDMDRVRELMAARGISRTSAPDDGVRYYVSPTGTVHAPDCRYFKNENPMTASEIRSKIERVKYCRSCHALEG